MSGQLSQHVCPSCDAPLAIDNFDMPRGVATCDTCNASHRLSTLAASTLVAKSLAESPPKGCATFERGRATIIRVSTRQPAGWFLVVFAAFWNFGVLNFGGDIVPAWMDVIRGASPGSSGSPMPVPMLIIMTMMFVPFVATGLGVIGLAVFLLIGRCEIRVDADSIRVHTGVFGIGRLKTFELASSLPVQIVTKPWQKKPGNDTLIQLGSREDATFGAAFTEARRAWTAAALTAAIQTRLAATAPRGAASPMSI
jgi:hypothetical protein